MPFGFTLRNVDPSGARCGLVETDHGPVETPAFMPVGTQGTVKTLSARDLEEIGASMILSNTYHLYLRPGEKLIEEAGGIHRFMGWKGPVLTDSGGYQVLSLADLSRIADEGVEFKSHLDGSTHFLTPERVVDIQLSIGSDVMMVLDECAEYPCDRERAEKAVERTTLWAARSLAARGARVTRAGYERVLFGIVQGSLYPDLRERSAREIVALDFPGYAIGGLSVGESKAETFDTAARTASLLPADKPRYLMGVGHPEDIVEAVARGDRSLRLRRADAQREERERVHLAGKARRQKRGIRPGRRSARSRLRLRGMPDVQPRVSPAPLQRGRDARAAARDLSQPLFLLASRLGNEASYTGRKVFPVERGLLPSLQSGRQCA